jgi:hypothetical protein
MSNYKQVKYAVINRGLVDNYYVRIFLDNGASYDRYFIFTMKDKPLMNLFGNIVKSKQYAVQSLQSDYKRFQEIAEAVVKGEQTAQVNIKELHPIKIDLFQEEQDNSFYWRVDNCSTMF